MFLPLPCLVVSFYMNVNWDKVGRILLSPHYSNIGKLNGLSLINTLQPITLLCNSITWNYCNAYIKISCITSSLWNICSLKRARALCLEDVCVRMGQFPRAASVYRWLPGTDRTTGEDFGPGGPFEYLPHCQGGRCSLLKHSLVASWRLRQIGLSLGREGLHCHRFHHL